MKKRPKEVRIEYELTDLPITALGGLPVVIEAAKALGIDHPFNSSLTINIVGNNIRQLTIFDPAGRRVGILPVPSDKRALSWQPVNLPAGSYFIQANASFESSVTRIVYLK